jgi:hypothetical protein
VFRRVDDDLLPLEGRVEVRHDADLPGVAEPQRLRRRPVLTAAAEGTALELVRGRRPDLRQPGARPLAPPGRDQDAPPGERILADLGQGLELPSPVSKNGRKSSIGSGRMIVEERSELISSIV